MGMRKLLALLCSCYCIGLIQGQTINLVPDPDLVISESTCFSILIGSSLTFQRDPSCDPNILISSPLGLIEYLSTSEEIITYTFSEIGEYVVFCGANDASVAISATCIIVGARAIPVVSEWCIFSLFLTFLILSVIGIKERPYVNPT